MKKLLLVAGALTALTLAGCAEKTIVQNGEGAHHTISVSGQASEEVSPDVAYLSLEVTAENPSSEEAQKESATLMNNIIEKLKQAGVEEGDIETTHFNMNLIRDFKNELYPMPSPVSDESFSSEVIAKDLPNQIVGYSVSNQVKVTINDLANVSKVIDSASSERNVTINNLSFSLKDKGEATKEVTDQAIADAKGQAERMAKSLDVKIKGVHKVTTSNNAGPTYYANDMMMAKSAGMESTPISPEDVTIQSTVNVDFIIE